jgi:hypothetical protein
MSDYDKEKQITSELTELAMKYNKTIMTATQPKRESDSSFNRNLIRDNITVIDHINIIKLNRKK